MTNAALGRGAVLAIIAVALFGCGGGQLAYEDQDPGLYALEGGELQRLDGDAEWERETWPERSNFGPNVRFVVVHPSLSADPAAAGDAIHLRQVGWVRSDVSARGTIGPPGGTRWVAPDVRSFDIPLGFVAVGGDALQVQPAAPLEPGLYSLQFDGGGRRIVARVGVRWGSVDRNTYASAHCVDRYVGGGGATYRLCAEQAAASISNNLRVHLVAPEQETVNGATRLVVKGVVVNVSEAAQRVPVLQAKLQDRSGRVLHSWLFSLSNATKLSPGESASFRTITRKVPRGTANVTVDFADFRSVPNDLTVERPNASAQAARGTPQARR